ncbi:MAG: hypothetical protein ABIJ57_17260 [Pseudomonadota bacterium]
MKKIGKWIILRATEHEEIQRFYPLYEKAIRLARTLTEDQIDEILAGKRHTRRNPRKKTMEIIGKGAAEILDQVGTYPATGE